MLMQSWLSGLGFGRRSRGSRTLRRRRRVERLSTPAEVLEVRTLLSGTVTATLSLGTLTITGDTNANGVTLQNTGGTNHLQTDGTTTLIFNGVNRGTGADVAGLSFFNVTMDMKDGNDNVQLGNGGAGLAVSGSLNVALGTGQDTLNMQNVSVGLWTTITGSGTGQDAVSIAGSTLHGTSITSGNGLATIGISNSTFKGNLAITTGDANDAVNFSGNIAVADGLLRYGVTVNTGGGTDQINIDPTVGPGQHLTWVSGNVMIDAGDGGTDEFSPQRINIAGDVDGQSNPSSFSWQSGAVSIKSGSGFDNVAIGGFEIEGATFTWNSGNVSIDTGAGDDRVNVVNRLFSQTDAWPVTSVSWNSGSIAINTGAGNDRVAIAGNLIANGAFPGSTSVSLNWSSGAIAINLGNGNDTLDFAETQATAFNGGSSVCTLNMNAPSVSINTGDGNDSVTFLDSVGQVQTSTGGVSAVANSNLATSFLNVTLGDGNDSLTMVTSEVFIDAGTPASRLTALLTTINLGNGAQAVQIGGSNSAFAIATGTTTVNGSISVNGLFKSGPQTVNVLGDGAISGNLSMTLGSATVTLAPPAVGGLTIGGYTSISTTGAPIDTVTLDRAHFVGAVTVSTAQPDVLNIDGSEFDSLFQAFMSGGTINLARNFGFGPTEFKGPAFFFVGAGGVINASHATMGSTPLIFDSLFEVVGGIPFATLTMFGPIDVNPLLEILILTNVAEIT